MGYPVILYYLLIVGKNTELYWITLSKNLLLIEYNYFKDEDENVVILNGSDDSDTE